MVRFHSAAPFFLLDIKSLRPAQKAGFLLCGMPCVFQQSHSNHAAEFRSGAILAFSLMFLSDDSGVARYFLPELRPLSPFQRFTPIPDS